MIISTGSRSFDSLLGGGIRSGMVTDFIGRSGTGKSQLCFTVCVNSAKQLSPGEFILFIDTTGTFRPERIQEISNCSGENDVLGKISYIRVYNSYDQNLALFEATKRSPKLIIIDNVSSLISNEFSGARKHLHMMKHVHSLGLIAITLDCTVIVTNMLMYASNEGELLEREALASSISSCVHVRVMLERTNFTRPIYKASLVHPSSSRSCLFDVRKIGITNA
jgi:RecA/RadA recombinase